MTLKSESPENLEQRRLKSVERYSEHMKIVPEALDDIVKLAMDLLRVPIGQINLLGADTQRSLLAYGLAGGVLPRQDSFCNVVVEQGKAAISNDATTDPRFAKLPLVRAGDVRAYLGAPLMTRGGENIGALCVADHVQRDFNDADRQVLERLAALIIDELDLQLRERELDEARSRLQVLVQLSELGDEEGTIDQLFEQVGAALSSVMPFSFAALCKVQGSNVTPLSVFNTVPDDLAPSSAANAQPLAPKQSSLLRRSLEAQTLGKRKPLYITAYSQQEGAHPRLRALGIEGLACLQLTADLYTPQLLVVGRRSSQAWNTHEQSLLSSAAHSLARILERRTRWQQMKYDALHDPLTDLGNRRSFEQELSRLDKEQVPYVLGMVDLDGMKAVNDLRGHAQGDELLRLFACKLREVVGPLGRIYRLGGDEFALLLEPVGAVPQDMQTDLHLEQQSLALEVLLRRAEAQVRDLGFPEAGASFGVAVVGGLLSSSGAVDGPTALSVADAQMYCHKREGRRHPRV